MIVALLVIPMLVAVVLWIRRRRRNAKLVATPLGGIDTGVRSAWRTPNARLFGPRRGF